MMDALKFLEECARMCNSVKECSSCPVHGENCYITSVLHSRNKEQLVLAVEKWSADHPVKTRQSEFLKMFPNASIGVNGTLIMCPCHINTKFESEFCEIGECEDCKKEYWLAEVE